MSNIVITHYSGIVHKQRYMSSVFYDGLIKALIANGHNVLQITTSDFLKTPWNGSNTPYFLDAKNQVLSKIKKFSPDLVISFNNSSIEDIETAVACPIALWDADSFQFFNDKNNIKNNIDRYHFMSFSEAGIEDYKRNLDIKDNYICKVPSATEIETSSETKKYNISFIGNPFFKSDTLTKFLSKHPELIHLNQVQSDTDLNDIEELLQTNKVSTTELKHHKSGDLRLNPIIQLIDLKPKIFGPDEWLKLGTISSEFIEAYEPRSVYSLIHNQKVYNRSKISLSASHTQIITGYPWRVLDIMASSSVLLSDCKSDLLNDFSDNVDLQIYQTPAEAYTIARKLLSDKPKRIDIISQQQDAINNGFRWKHRFPLIQQLTGVDLIPKITRLGIHEHYQPNYSLLHHNTFNEIAKFYLRNPTKNFKKSIKLIKRSIIKKPPESKGHDIEYT